MQNIAKNMEQIQPSLEYGRIVAGDAERFIVQDRAFIEELKIRLGSNSGMT